jgi:hypothetical protein
MSNKDNVTVGKPAIAGAISIAPEGTDLPTSASAALDQAFSRLGYVSEDGLVQSTDMSSTDINAWGGDKVLTVIESIAETYQYTLIEGLNIDVLKHAYGEDNVSASSGSLTIMHRTAGRAEPHVIVVDMLVTGSRKRRIVIPLGVLSDVSDVTNTDTEPISYGLTISALTDGSGVTSYEYIEAPPETTS